MATPILQTLRQDPGLQQLWGRLGQGPASPGLSPKPQTTPLSSNRSFPDLPLRILSYPLLASDLPQRQPDPRLSPSRQVSLSPGSLSFQQQRQSCGPSTQPLGVSLGSASCDLGPGTPSRQAHFFTGELRGAGEGLTHPWSAQHWTGVPEGGRQRASLSHLALPCSSGAFETYKTTPSGKCYLFPTGRRNASKCIYAFKVFMRVCMHNK